MKIQENERKTGSYQKLGDLNYFVPYPLPPKNPPFEMNSQIATFYGEAAFALGQLNEMGNRLPDLNRFIKAYIIKEALLSSAIEGIHTTLIEVFTQPFGDAKPSKDTQLVLNYSLALDAALKMLQGGGYPLVSRVILKAHEALMSLGEGEKASPGVFRKQSVRVGAFVPPPPPHEVPNLMGDLEKYINEASELPELIQAGLVHVQFEIIHPFLDGNGRIGRLCIVLMLLDKGLLNVPILYPSYFFKKNQLEYYQYLDRVRTHGDYESWIIFYLKSIKYSAIDAYRRAKEIEELEINLKDLIKREKSFTKMRETALRVLEYLFSHPVSGIADISQKLGKAYNTIQKTLNEFIKIGLVTESKVHKRNKRYKFDSYLLLLEKEYDGI